MCDRIWCVTSKLSILPHATLEYHWKDKICFNKLLPEENIVENLTHMEMLKQADSWNTILHILLGLWLNYCLLCWPSTGSIWYSATKILIESIHWDNKDDLYVDLPYVPVWPGLSRFKRLPWCPVPVSKMSRNFTSVTFSKWTPVRLRDNFQFQ